ncbi:hypothetical protein C1645_808283 [Glomus cerebriforme]|uniref:MIR domain-containing protein n=1 Tax=Glomus cerebriforme TaxID=658196 RepID=A0A397SRV5_9GLOM|nr:hypothetical protein C1645_808283 [Glomus cerebriforme]
MDVSKYDGTIHPDEWIEQIRKYYYGYKHLNNYYNFEEFTRTMIDSTISIPDFADISELINLLKQHITFTAFKNSRKRKLQSLKFIPERQGGDTTSFLVKFRSFCRDAEINDIEEIKTYFYKTLPKGFIQDKFLEQMNNGINSMNELTQLFENIMLEDSILIRNGSRVAIKHVATGKYLSASYKCYQNTNRKIVYAGSVPNSDAQWIVKFSGLNELALNESTLLILDHEIYQYLFFKPFSTTKSPASKNMEVTCGTSGTEWKFKSKNNRKYLKSHDIIFLESSIKHLNLRSHDFTFTVDDVVYQEVVAHEERIGGNDEWYIELLSYN